MTPVPSWVAGALFFAVVMVKGSEKGMQSRDEMRNEE